MNTSLHCSIKGDWPAHATEIGVDDARLVVSRSVVTVKDSEEKLYVMEIDYVSHMLKVVRGYNMTKAFSLIDGEQLNIGVADLPADASDSVGTLTLAEQLSLAERKLEAAVQFAFYHTDCSICPCDEHRGMGMNSCSEKGSDMIGFETQICLPRIRAYIERKAAE